MTTPTLSNNFAAALNTACEWHAGQYRKVPEGETPTIPYISHLLGVASIALEFGANEAEAIAALLHDALEDGPQYAGKDAAELRATIEEQFGAEVAHLVDGATDAMPKAGEEKEPWQKRKTKYLAKLPQEPASSLLISASDKLHNARTILTDVLTLPAEERGGYFTRFKQGQAGTLQYYRLLADAYRAVRREDVRQRPRLQVLFAELSRTVGALEGACGLTADEVRDYPPLRGAAGLAQD
ncbi:phosphohydrolase [Deinococcus radiopugnans]|uniref:Phosphohydrolase n=1 Tax=Deinococcus radiopugnans TaxID=57497 RepID=A0A0A7KH57_9DEIO|nr:HD domain-containing protein [Deinococcus radiopugnans]AIZ44569.1 phosphohydrolase [Deinococcus radiopugnans]